MKNIKSYTELNGHKPFNWHNALNKDYGLANFLEMSDIKEKAGDWKRCPISQLPVFIDRSPSGSPIDEKLHDLGLEFSKSCKEMFNCLYSYANAKDANVYRIKANVYRIKAQEILAIIKQREEEVIKEKIDKLTSELATIGYVVKKAK